MKNLYFSDKVRSEQNLYEDIVIESLKTYGQDVYYLPRDLVKEDRILGEDVPSRFNSSHKIEMYLENIDGFDGEGDLFTRFGVEIRDEATFVVSRRRWTQQVARMDSGVTAVRPLEGDLIYLPLTNKLFEIQFVEHEQPFYQLSNLPVFKLRATLFEYNDEDLDTGIEEIDKIERDYSYSYVLTVNRDSPLSINDRIGLIATQTFGSGVVMQGEIAKWSDSDNKVHLIHAGADDGKFHNFVAGQTVTGLTTGSTGVISLIVEDNQLSENEQNTSFSSGADFIDFSESNPFGDVSNN